MSLEAYRLLGAVLGLIGIVVLAILSPGIAAGVTLMLWGNNLERRGR